MTARPPPGRAGRVWLARRAATAAGAAELLQRKQQLLRHEQRRLLELTARTERDWQRLAREAEVATMRALVAGGRDDLVRTAPNLPPAELQLQLASRAGVVYPDTAQVEFAPVPDLGPGPAWPAAARAGREGITAAVRHAAARAALDRVEAELAATVRRLRAVRDRWLPDLRAQLHALDLQLDETERQEIGRLRSARPPLTGKGDGS